MYYVILWTELGNLRFIEKMFQKKPFMVNRVMVLYKFGAFQICMFLSSQII